jgi:rRNA-processing protein FCF1
VSEPRRSEVLLDANLLILLIVGLVAPTQIGRHKNTSNYAVGDFTLLSRILAASDPIVVTPNIVTEASNLLRQTHDPLRTELGLALRGVLEATREIHIASSDASWDSAFLRLGLTDVAILTAARHDLTVLTDDGDLYVAATQRGLPAVKFSHRQAAEA